MVAESNGVTHEDILTLLLEYKINDDDKGVK